LFWKAASPKNKIFVAKNKKSKILLQKYYIFIVFFKYYNSNGKFLIGHAITLL